MITRKEKTMISYNDRMIWWTFFLSEKKYWGHGLTLSKLTKIKDNIFQDGGIWYDLIIRHNFNRFPWEERDLNKDMFEHAIGNFAGSIYKKAYKLRVIG